MGASATPATATAAVVSTAPTSAETLLAQRTAAQRAARLERQRLRRERRREHRREMRKHRRWVRQHQALVRSRKTLRAFHIGQDQKGDPYRYGATGPSSFDCSGLTSYAYARAGLHLPRTSAAQAGAVRHIPRSQLRRGDLVFFSSGGHVYHVGLFAGRRGGSDYILHAPYTGAHVRTERIWTGNWFAGTVR